MGLPLKKRILFPSELRLNFAISFPPLYTLFPLFKARAAEAALSAGSSADSLSKQHEALQLELASYRAALAAATGRAEATEAAGAEATERAARAERAERDARGGLEAALERAGAEAIAARAAAGECFRWSMDFLSCVCVLSCHHFAIVTVARFEFPLLLLYGPKLPFLQVTRLPGARLPRPHPPPLARVRSGRRLR